MAEENSNVEVDHDVIGRLVVSPDSEVMFGFLRLILLLLICPDCHRVHVCSLWSAAICLPIEESVRDESGTHITPKEAKDMLQQ